jgi:hypothetical protein
MNSRRFLIFKFFPLTTMFKQFTDNLKKILIPIFGVLDPQYTTDVLDDAAYDLQSELSSFYEVRFGLLQKDQVELKAGLLFRTEKEAQEIADLTDARVGMMLVPTK